MDGAPQKTDRGAASALSSLDVTIVAILVLVGLTSRFVTRSSLWLDEALSVNIASLPLAEIGEALRRDGHPPLYYWLLHGWMKIFGTTDTAVRALSGVFGALSLPLAYAAGRRRAGQAAGLCVLALTAITPWAVRYATEARMYSLVVLLVFAGWLLADDLLDRPSRWRWSALAMLTGAALLTHYWVLYLVVAAVVLLAWRWRRAGDSSRSGCLRVATSLAGGAALFAPWVPSFLAQAARTGTPWASPGRPTAAVTELLGALGGEARYAEAVLFGIGFCLLVVLGLVALPDGRRRAALDFGTVPGVRTEVAVGLLTAAVGLMGGLLTGVAFHARYAAAFLPMLIIAAGVGLARLPAPWPRRLSGVALTAFAGVGIVANVVDQRTQGEEVAGAIAASASSDDLVVVCPDQLGPAALRSLPGELAAVGLPTFDRPIRIDWRDYAERNESAEPDAAVERILQQAGDAAVWMVLDLGYRTYEGYCEAVLTGLRSVRPAAELVVKDRVGDVYETMILYRFPEAG